MTLLRKVWQLKKFLRLPPGAARMNCLAAFIGALAVVILALNFHATPAGAGLDAASLAGGQFATGASPMISMPLGGSDQGLSGLSADELNKRIHGAIHGSKLALQLHVALLELGRHRIENFPDYSATFFKQERVDGDALQELQSCQLKLRHKPFSVYMKWLEGGDVGRQVLFVEGEHDDKMLVKLGGRKAVLPTLKLDPNGSMALQESRHPVVEMGLLQLADLIIKYRKRDLALQSGLRWQMVPDQKIMDRDCHGFVVEYDSREIEPVYRKTITYIDKEWSIPICVRNFGWPTEPPSEEQTETLDEATLIEYYGYKDLQFETRLSDADFDKGNSDYKFRR
ncbi:MAG: DUF1571 domain-containing protein [Planctomycetales bacterium]